MVNEVYLSIVSINFVKTIDNYLKVPPYIVHNSRGRCFTVPSSKVQFTPAPNTCPAEFFAKEMGDEKTKQAINRAVIFFMMNPLHY
ncbi:hypothetical protein AND4_04950 [Vibrio sp. AND4]|nr:hypothetical protein AND4_04950 [Vibrio sp. AND4]